MTGKELCALRQAAGLSQLELAILLRVAQATVEDWERAGLPNGVELERDMLLKLAEWQKAREKPGASRVGFKPADAWLGTVRGKRARARAAPAAASYTARG